MLVVDALPLVCVCITSRQNGDMTAWTTRVSSPFVWLCSGKKAGDHCSQIHYSSHAQRLFISKIKFMVLSGTFGSGALTQFDAFGKILLIACRHLNSCKSCDRHQQYDSVRYLRHTDRLLAESPNRPSQILRSFGADSPEFPAKKNSEDRLARR